MFPKTYSTFIFAVNFSKLVPVRGYGDRMRQIQIERKLFELFEHKFLVFENFEDSDLDIDNKSVYKYDNDDNLVDVFVTNKFHSIWNDERRYNATVICACHGNLKLIIHFLQRIGVANDCYATFNCGALNEDRVLYITSKAAMQLFTKHVFCAKKSQNHFFNSQMPSLRKKEISRS